MAVVDKLSCFCSGVSPAESINNIVKSAFADFKQVFTGNALLALSHKEIFIELLLGDTVVTLGLLLSTKLKSVFCGLLAALTMLTGSIRSAL